MKHLRKLNRREVVQAAMGAASLTALTTTATVKTAKAATTAIADNPVVETAAGKVRGYPTQ